MRYSTTQSALLARESIYSVDECQEAMSIVGRALKAALLRSTSPLAPDEWETIHILYKAQSDALTSLLESLKVQVYSL